MIEQQIGGKLLGGRQMNNSSAVPSSKARAGPSQPAEATFKRKRGVFQKDCEFLPLFTTTIKQLFFAQRFSILCSLVCFLSPSYSHLSVPLDVPVQHMMYGFGDDPNVCSLSLSLSLFFMFLFTIGCYIHLKLIKTRI